MLEPWIIEQIRRREEEARRQSERPQLEMPVPMPQDYPDHAQDDDEADNDTTERGVVIIGM